MTDIDPIEQLQKEHRAIQQVIDGPVVLIERLEAAKPVPPEMLADISKFLQRFAGDCHHGKEEIYLFRLLEKNGVPKDGCPISALVHEHHKGRALLATLKLACKQYAQSRRRRAGLLWLRLCTP